MQAIRNKFHGKSKRNSLNNDRKIIEERTETVTTTNAPISNSYGTPLPRESFSETTTTTINETPIQGSYSSIPTPPPMPPADFYKDSSFSSSIPTPMPTDLSNGSSTRSSSMLVMPSVLVGSSRMSEMLPTEIIEKPVVIHENIRREQIEEIQPVVQVEREKTEIRQITQPLTDREVMPVLIEERTLPIEVLPTLTQPSMPAPQRLDVSTRSFDNTMRQVVEKTPIVQETEKWRIIEEVQPIIYRETIVPHVIRTTRPMREVIVEAPIFTEQVLQTRELSLAERERFSQFLSQASSRELIIESGSSLSMQLPISRSVAPVMAPVMAPVAPVMPQLAPVVHHKKEILEEVITTTTTTTAAPTISTGRSSTRGASDSGVSSSVAPVVVDHSHAERFGPKGERIVTDSETTSTMLPTRAV